MTTSYHKNFPTKDEAFREAGRLNADLKRKCLGSASSSDVSVSVILHQSDAKLVSGLLKDGFKNYRTPVPASDNRQQENRFYRQVTTVETDIPVLIHDLIYDGDAIVEIKAAFPDAKTEDASDMVHEGRFSVEVTSTYEDYFYKIVKLGMGGISLTTELTARLGKDGSAAFTGLMRAIDRLQAEKGD